MLRVAAWAFRTGIRKGVVGGSGPWMVVAVAAGAFRFLNRPGKHGGGRELLHLRPGDRLVVVCAEE